MTKDFLVASRYAEALFQIARSLHQDEEVQAELESFSSALKSSPDLEQMLKNPSFKIEEKRGFLQRIYQERRQEIYEILLNFFTVLFEKNRFDRVCQYSRNYGQGTRNSYRSPRQASPW